MQTCRHFRHQIPEPDADDLRDADPEPCEVCDALRSRRRAQQVVWNPRGFEPAGGLSFGERTRLSRRLQTVLRFFG